MVDFSAGEHRPGGRVVPGRMAGLAVTVAPQISMQMVPDALPEELSDPYSDLVSRAFERIGPAVVGVRAARKDGRPLGQGSGVVYPALWSRGFAREKRNGDQHDAYSVAAWLPQADLTEVSPPSSSRRRLHRNARWRRSRGGFSA